ncbi:hypothetical protein V6N13_124108 [Hibiscus sabdariffa]
MESDGNEKFNTFLAQCGIPKETDIVTKYNSNAASIYRDRIQALAEGRPIVEETLNNKEKNGDDDGDEGWDSWDNDDSFRSSNDLRRNQSTIDFRGDGDGDGDKHSIVVKEHVV